jgi:hypothetical protein
MEQIKNGNKYTLYFKKEECKNNKICDESTHPHDDLLFLQKNDSIIPVKSEIDESKNQFEDHNNILNDISLKKVEETLKNVNIDNNISSENKNQLNNSQLTSAINMEDEIKHLQKYPLIRRTKNEINHKSKKGKNNKNYYDVYNFLITNEVIFNGQLSNNDFIKNKTNEDSKNLYLQNEIQSQDSKNSCLFI